jgi:hypothetical protein
MKKPLIIVTAFGCLLASTVFTSCGANGSAFTPVSPPSGKGVVYIYRTPSFVGCAATGTLKTNGFSTTIVSNGGYFPYVGPPGDTTFTSKIDWNRKVTVRVEQGNPKYLKAEFAGAGMQKARILKLTEVPPSLGASEITECKLLEPVAR